jgi:hypothetical protein
MEKIDGTYCPLCGEIGLARGKHKGAEWAYCPKNATGPADAHTAYILRVLEVAKPTKKGDE